MRLWKVVGALDSLKGMTSPLTLDVCRKSSCAYLPGLAEFGDNLT